MVATREHGGGPEYGGVFEGGVEDFACGAKNPMCQGGQRFFRSEAFGILEGTGAPLHRGGAIVSAAQGDQQLLGGGFVTGAEASGIIEITTPKQ